MGNQTTYIDPDDIWPVYGTVHLLPGATLQIDDGATLSKDGTTVTTTGTELNVMDGYTATGTFRMPIPLSVSGSDTVTMGELQGVKSLDFDADGEDVSFSFRAPPNWDAASDLTINLMVGNEIAEDDGDDVSFTGTVRGFADGEALSTSGQTVACTLNLTGGDEAINVVNKVTGTIDYDDGTYPIAAGDVVAVRLVVNITGGGECTGPLHIVNIEVEYTGTQGFST